ncbi:beta-1,6-N-acetylglucosaminyltransferase [Kluyvera sp. STS39-E]|uniref:beta-1,6-N-acetylglucosaminyltransferase n=1 Tax=Kluyvera sp. STS39-E TaxID=3234748 RepID=UPI0034C662B5
MKLAYLIQCHKNPEQIEMLIESLDLDIDDNVIIHVDAKCNDTQEKIKILSMGYKNVHVVPHSVTVNWSGKSQIYATLKMIDYLYSNNMAYDYCLLISGEDVVLNPNKLKDFLGISSNKSFIEFRSDHAKYYWRINRYNIFRDCHLSQSWMTRAISSVFVRSQRVLNIKRNNFRDEDIYLGSQWVTISRQHMDILLDFIDDKYLKKFNYTSCSDEHFFQMLFKQCINADEYETYNFRHIKFAEGANSPSYLSISELMSVRDYPNIFIARKVTSTTLSEYLLLSILD